MNWHISHRADKLALPIADRHYNRQKVGTPQFVPPGSCLVLTCVSGQALWVTSWPFPQWTKHAWRGAWVNSCFRRESGPLASELIGEAMAVTRWFWPEYQPRIVCPHCDAWVSMVSFIDPRKTRHKRDPGRCFARAGFTRCTGKTEKDGLTVMHIDVADMPLAQQPMGTTSELFRFEEAV